MNSTAKKADSFLYTCKLLDFLSTKNEDSRDIPEYRQLVNIAKSYFSEGLYDQIAQYLYESKYRVNYWAAYLILNYGQPDEELRSACLGVVNITDLKNQ